MAGRLSETVRKTNVLAIVSIVAGISAFLGFVLVGAVVAIVAGHVARRQIKRTGEGGGRLAVIGLVLGYAHLAIDVSYLGFALFMRLWVMFSPHSAG